MNNLVLRPWKITASSNKKYTFYRLIGINIIRIAAIEYWSQEKSKLIVVTVTLKFKLTNDQPVIPESYTAIV